MDILNLALKYYITVTNNTVFDFYDKIMDACSDDLVNQTGEPWLIHALVERIIQQGIPFNAILDAKTLVINQFDNEVNNNIQSYKINKIWCKETYKFIEPFLSENTVFVTNDKDLYGLIEKKGYLITNSFVDLEIVDFVNELTHELFDLFKNNKNIVLLLNIPQYKENISNVTADKLHKDGFVYINENVYIQTLYKVLELKKYFNLSNFNVGFFGDSILYTDEKYNGFINLFKKNFNFVDGFYFSLKDFGASLVNISCMHFSMWSVGEPNDNPILMHKKRLATKTRIETGEIALFDLNNISLHDWLDAKDVLFYKIMPILTNYGTFLNGTLLDRTAVDGNKCAENSLGSFTISDNMKDIEKAKLLSSVGVQPKGKNNRIKVIDITKENFWRCVSVFAFTKLVNKNWNNEKEIISAPNEKVKGYTEWVYNALPLFLLDSDAMFSAINRVKFNDDFCNIRNHMFFVDKQSLSLFCDDPFLEQQLQLLDNSFILEQLAIAKPYWKKETKQFFDLCLDLVLRTLKERKNNNYEFGTDAIDAGFVQVVELFKKDYIYQTTFKRVFNVYKEELYKDISKFGFLKEF